MTYPQEALPILVGRNSEHQSSVVIGHGFHDATHVYVNGQPCRLGLSGERDVATITINPALPAETQAVTIVVDINDPVKGQRRDTVEGYPCKPVLIVDEAIVDYHAGTVSLSGQGFNNIHEGHISFHSDGGWIHLEQLHGDLHHATGTFTPAHLDPHHYTGHIYVTISGPHDLASTSAVVHNPPH